MYPVGELLIPEDDTVDLSRSGLALTLYLWRFDGLEDKRKTVRLGWVGASCKKICRL